MGARCLTHVACALRAQKFLNRTSGQPTAPPRVGPDCLTSDVYEDSQAEGISSDYGVANENTTLSCVFGQQTEGRVVTAAALAGRKTFRQRL